MRIDARLSFDRRILLMSFMGGLPGTAVALVLLWSSGFTLKVAWTFTAAIVSLWFGFAFALRRRAVMPLQTLANLLAALRESDFSIRARSPRRDDSLGEVTLEVNELAETLREQRLGAMEATNLLKKMMAEIDVAVFAFDDDETLRLVNRAGERLLAQPAERLVGRAAADLGLSASLLGQRAAGMGRGASPVDQRAAETSPGWSLLGQRAAGASRGASLGERAPVILDVAFPGGAGRWEVRRTTFRQGGRPMQMLVLADVSRALRQEEYQAWQRLIRVLGHELNNSLAPIHSIAGSLGRLLARRPLPDDWEDDAQRGLAVIEARAGSLSRFMEAYARMSRLPPPRLQPLDLGALVRRVARLETRMDVRVLADAELTLPADSDQIEQLVINLVRNAVDAGLETGGSVALGWTRNGSYVELFVRDEGPGLSNTSNLFVPFFTTKPGGSGIGLVLSRQIAEAHGGALTVENRSDGRGCEARLRLPLQSLHA